MSADRGKRSIIDGEAEAVSICRAVIDRLRIVIEEENHALASQEIRTHDVFAGRKNQLLRELLAAQRGSRSQMALSTIAESYASLKSLLARNEMLLKHHMRALEAVSAIIVDCIRHADSDGTYSQPGQRLRIPKC